MFRNRLGPRAAALAVVVFVSALHGTGIASATAPVAHGSDPVDGGATGKMIVAGTSVSETFPDSDVRRATIEFGEPTTGDFVIQSVESLPAGTPAPDGEMLGAVDVSTPDLAEGRDPRVKLTLAREALAVNDAAAEDLRIVRLSDLGSSERLSTTVVRRGSETVTVVAEAHDFDVFAVVEPDEAATTPATPTPTLAPTSTPTAVPEPTPTATTTPEPSATATSTPPATPERTAGVGPGFGPVATLLAVVAGLVAVATRRR